MCKIVYEDNHLLIAVKPPNLLTQADHTGDADLLTQLKAYVKEKYKKPGDVYLGLVHRMDRPVGGLLAFARTSKAASRLSQQVSCHQMGREYLLVCQGTPAERFTLTDWLLKDERLNRVSSVPEGTAGAKKAVLHGHTLASRDGLSLVAVRLETGRAHQIRVQMMTSGHPLWGDNRYGQGKPGQQIALWGAKLTLTHPTLKNQMIFYDLPSGSVWDQFKEALTHGETLFL